MSLWSCGRPVTAQGGNQVTVRFDLDSCEDPPRLIDKLSLFFVFIDILALFPRLSTLNGQSGWRRPRLVGSAMSRRDRSPVAVQFNRIAPPARRRPSGSSSLPAQDFLPLCFVFIDILALFRRIQVEKSRVESRRVTNRQPPTRPFDLAPQLLNSATS